jgi:pimeloyl-ACP methyl ester carboxylesterase
MSGIYKSAEGERAVKERYRQFLAHWPVANRQFHVPTREGETFVIACGPENAPALVLLHGSAFNSVTWMGDVAAWARHFRVYAVDVIGHPNLSAPSRPSYASDAYALWLDDVLHALSVERASFAGISLGGWLALDYAIRRPERVASLVLLCPGGVGRETTSSVKLVLVILPLLLLGRWGRRRATQMMLGAANADPSPAAKAVGDFMSLIFRHFRQNLAKVSRFSDEALARVRSPVLLIVGARDAMIDSAQTRRRLEHAVPAVEVRWLADAGHAVLGQTAPIEDFLLRNCGSPPNSATVARPFQAR